MSVKLLLYVIKKEKIVMRSLQLILLTFSLFIVSLSVFAQETQPLTLKNIKNALKNSSSELNIKCNTLEKMSKCLVDEINERFIDFNITSEDKRDLEKSGATKELIDLISFQSSKNYILLFLDYFTMKNPTEADTSVVIDSITKAIEQYKTGEYYFYRGLIKDDSGKAEGAIEDFLEAINLNFKDVEVYNQLGLAYYHVGKFNNAVESYKEAIRIDKYYSNAYYNLALVYYNQGNSKDAVENNKKAIENDDTYGKAYYGLGRIYLNNWQFDLALENFKKALERKYNPSWVYFYLGLTYQEKKDYKNAIANYNEAIKKDPLGVPSYVYDKLGWSYYELKMYDLAIENYKKSISIKPCYCSYFEIGIVYYDQEMYSDSVSNYQNAIKINPAFKPAYDKLELAFYKQGKEEEAKKVNVSRNSIPLNANNEDVYDNRKQIYTENNIAGTTQKEKLNIIYPSGKNIQDLQTRTNPLNLTIIKNFLDPNVFSKDSRFNSVEKANFYLIEQIKKRGIYFDVPSSGDIPSAISSTEIQQLRNLGVNSELMLLIKKYAALQNMLVAVALLANEENEQNYKQAIDLVTKSIELNKHGKFYFVRGNMYKELKKYDKAIEDFQEAIYLNFKSTNTYNDLGGSYYNQNKYEKAIEFYNEAIKSDSEFDEGYNNLGNAYYNTQKYDLAIYNYKKAIELKPKYNRYRYLGLAFYYNNQYQDAINSYKEAVKLKTDCYFCYNSLGLAHYQKKEYEEAISTYKKAIEIDKSAYFAYYNMALVYFNKGDDAKAKGEIDKANEYYETSAINYELSIKLNDKDVDSYLNLGRVRFRQGNTDQAIKLYNKTIEIDKDYYLGYYNLGYTYYATQKYKESIEFLTKAIALNQKDPDAYWYRWKSYEKIGDKEKSEADMKKYEELTKNQKP
jgi:tetratricopeptide (TPR) repeat protein